MKAFHFVMAIVLLSHISCNRVDHKGKLDQVVLELVNAQEALKHTENERDMKTSLIELYKNVKTNLVLCDNFDFTIRVDRLVNDSLRYTCWKKPKSTYDIPDFVLDFGIRLENSTDDRQEYLFSNADWNYSVERIISKDVSNTVHIFLEVKNKDGKENYAWKMRDLSNSSVQ